LWSLGHECLKNEEKDVELDSILPRYGNFLVFVDFPVTDNWQNLNADCVRSLPQLSVELGICKVGNKFEM
jgi:hypothetical protein